MVMPHKTDIKSLNYNELVQYVESINEKKFRAAQLYSWMHEKLAESYDEMTNISDKLKNTLKEDTLYTSLKIVKMQESRIDGTRKYLFELYDGNLIESVFMKYHHGNSVCISSQVGCKMGCRFCASTLNGCVRNLLPSEMLDQIYRISRDTNERVSNVVIMGSGEPMLNYDNVLNFIRLVHEPYCLNLGYRNITISTSGIVPGINKLAQENLPITLSISLHAPNNELRTELMPINKRYPIEEVIKAAVNYANTTKRRITYEYILIDKYNDNMTEAVELCKLLKNQLANVNLIPINPVKERNYNRPSLARIKAFAKYLNDHHLTATIRQEMGTDIQAACGQLRNKHLAK